MLAKGSVSFQRREVINFEEDLLGCKSQDKTLPLGIGVDLSFANFPMLHFKNKLFLK